MNARGFLSLNLILILAAVAVVIAVGVAIDRAAVSRTNAGWELRVAQEKGRVAGITAAATARHNKLQLERDADAIRHESERSALRMEHDKRLSEFVPRTPDSRTCLRLGFVRYLDAAAAGVPLGPRIEPEVAAAVGEIGTDEAAAIISRNYARYNTCLARVEEVTQAYDDARATVNAAAAEINGGEK